ncbi:MAG: hypothetical protein HZA53_09975 [Planctomycetes bacterium]|nr:hypothetical protein [Planctomycetota bacterium]
MFLTTLLALAGTLLAPDPAQAPRPRAKETDGNRLVKVALVADHDGVRAGGTFELGIRLEVRPGWHIYWENAGDAGNPTRVELTGPDGFDIGRVRFPCPARHEEDGDIVSFVHEGSVWLLAEVRAPKELAPGTKLDFRVECDWLVCTDYCLPGSGRAKLELASVANDATPKAANEKEFTAGRAQHPKAWKDVLGTREPVFEAGLDGRSRVVIEVPEAQELEFFPDASATTKLVKRVRTRTEKGARLELELEQINGSKDVDYRGVLWIRDAKGACSVLQERWRPEKK